MTDYTKGRSLIEAAKLAKHVLSIPGDPYWPAESANRESTAEALESWLVNNAEELLQAAERAEKAEAEVLGWQEIAKDRQARDAASTKRAEAAESALSAANTRIAALEEGLRRVIEAAERSQGDHIAPDDCFATGPLTGNPIADLVACPGCTQKQEISDARALLSEGNRG